MMISGGSERLPIIELNSASPRTDPLKQNGCHTGDKEMHNNGATEPSVCKPEVLERVQSVM